MIVPDFRRHCIGAAFNATGSGGEQVVFGLLVFQITGSSAWVGVALALYYGPMMAVGVIGGAIADWADRRTLLRFLELALAALFALTGLLLAAGEVKPWQLMIMVLCSGCVRALCDPVRSSYAFDLVGAKQVVAGLGLINVARRLGQLCGALIAGSVMHQLGPDAAYVVLALAHVAAFVAVSGLRTAGTAAVAGSVSLLTNLREYVQELRRNRTLAMLVGVTITVEIFGFSFATALPELATRLQVDATGLGVMQATRAAGGLIAGIVLAGASGLERRGLYYLASIHVFGLALCALALDPTFTLAIAAIMLVAAAATWVDVLSQSMMQLSVPDALRGRAMGAWVFAAGTGPLGHLEMGALAASLGVGLAIGLNGLALVLAAITVTLAAPSLRRL